VAASGIISGVESPSTTGRMILALAGMAIAAVAGGAPVEVEVAWDPDLARPESREDYDRQLRAIVADARSRVVAGLGLEPQHSLIVIVRSRAAFEREFGAASAHLDAARFVGDVIHLNGGARLDDRLAGLVVHEMVHAALDARGTAAALPRWLDEGLAERLAWSRKGREEPAPNQVAELRQAREGRRLTPLPRDWNLSPFGYLQSWAAVLFLERQFGRAKVMAVVKATLGGEPFERALRRETGWSIDDLERAFEAWVGRL
jgi:hypothetical protein